MKAAILRVAATIALAASSVTAQQGTYTFVGSDCGDAQIAAVGVPTIGQTFRVEVLPDSSYVDGPLSYLATGFHLLPAPVDISVLSGGQPCGVADPAFCGVLFASIDVLQRAFGVASGGAIAFDFALPFDPTLIGLVFVQHNVTVGSGFGPRCVALSRAGVGVIGV